MKIRACTLIGVLCFCLSIQAAQPTEMPWRHGRLMVSANQRFLQHEDGTPFFWLGETPWLMPQRLTRDEVDYYMQVASKAGYNMVQVQVLNDVPSVNIYGQLSHPYGWDMTKADPDGVYSYWDHLDYIIHSAERWGIYVGLVTIWGSQVKNCHINEEQGREYAEFLAKRYGDSPNIIWILGGDIEGDIHPEVWQMMGATIKSIDHNHLMTYHPRGRTTSAKWFAEAEWIDFHTYQSGHRRYGQRMGSKTYPIPDDTEEDCWMYVDSTWSHRPVRPVIDDEPSYENIPKGLHDPDEGRWQAADVRRYAYWDVFAGCCGHSYGHNSIMQMLKPGFPTGYGRNGEEPTWTEALDAPGFQQMRILKDLMLSFPYFERIPDQSIILGDNGTRYDRLIATRGDGYLMVYNYTSRPMDISLKTISGKEKRLLWMDAATGKLTVLGTTRSDAFHYEPPQPKDREIADGVLIAVDTEMKFTGIFRNDNKIGHGTTNGR